MKWSIIEDMPHAHATDVATGKSHVLRIKGMNEGGPPPLRMVRYHLELLTPQGWVSLHHTSTLQDPQNESGNNQRTGQCQVLLKKYAAYLYEGDLRPVLE